MSWLSDMTGGQSGFFSDVVGAVLKPFEVGYNVFASERNRDDQNSLVHYQKAMNEVQMAREDNAIQRRSADMRKAGINPLLAAGNPASSSSVSAPSAPARVPQRISPMDLLAYEQGKANVAKTNAETTVAQNTAKNLTEQNKNLQEQNALLGAQTYESQARAAKLYAEISGKSFIEAGIDLFGMNFKYRSESYNNQPGSTPAPKSRSSAEPARSQIVNSLIRGEHHF